MLHATDGKTGLAGYFGSDWAGTTGVLSCLSDYCYLEHVPQGVKPCCVSESASLRPKTARNVAIAMLIQGMDSSP